MTREDLTHVHDALDWAYRFLQHTDEANAAANMAPCTARPLTRAVLTARQYAAKALENYGQSSIYDALEEDDLVEGIQREKK